MSSAGSSPQPLARDGLEPLHVRQKSTKKLKGGHSSAPPLPNQLSPQTQPSNQLAVAVYVLSCQISQMAAALADQLQQTPA